MCIKHYNIHICLTQDCYLFYFLSPGFQRVSNLDINIRKHLLEFVIDLVSHD